MTASGIKFHERLMRLARRVSLRDFLEILFWTPVVPGLWSLWNYVIWGWF